MSDDANWTGGWVYYRIYKNGNGEGVFYTIGCGAGPTSWEYTPAGGTKQTIEETLIWPQAVIGKRWNMSSGLTFSPFIGVGYMGYGMAKNILKNNFDLSVIAHKNRGPIEKLLKLGANEVLTYDELTNNIDILYFSPEKTGLIKKSKS